MEALLSLSFDNISSKDSGKIRKGLRQIEGLLAEICLSKSMQSSSPKKHERRASAIPTSHGGSSPKKLGALVEDLAFREFFRLQEGFEWNVALRLVLCLERLLGMGSSGQNDLLILSALDLLQGILLLHPPSRSLFGREIYMNLLLDLLDPSTNPPAIQSAALLTLVTSLLSHPTNTRTFEAIDGLLTVTSLFKSRSTSQSLKLKVLEFLYFYLMPEAAPQLAGEFGGTSSSTPNTGVQRSPSKRMRSAGEGAGDGGGGGGGDDTRTTEEKMRLLGKYLSNVGELVQDLREGAAFGGVVC
ncbi:hypothetical protein H2201_006816 [Coniosporium apollinis]|uniref:Cell division control protein 14 n=1 Tax=Coniosporium apollinis TaxID=61459 RepID=A0ABQ9NKT8_9PEZI|nr:hypothetical protein H2201_006816 [Coniosporium apollinis]